MEALRCEYLGCFNEARRADVERRRWHNDQRPVYCEPCDDAIHAGTKPVRPKCAWCTREASAVCVGCGRLICINHRRHLFVDSRMDATPRRCVECHANPNFYNLQYSGRTYKVRFVPYAQMRRGL